MKKELNKSLNIDLEDQLEVDKWCSIFKCSESTLRFCVSYVGRSITSVESFYSMNLNWIEKRSEMS